jgi:hypothetical protein
VTPADATEGVVLIYFRNGEPEHAGKWAGKRVISKWGSGPTNIWEHGLYEAPASYGDDVKVFSPVGNPVKLYRKWADCNGIS